jgi:hypothetical protein
MADWAVLGRVPDNRSDEGRGRQRCGFAGGVVRLTKIDAAQAHIRAAVRMFFEGVHPAPVFMIANAAREIVEKIGDHTDVTTVQEELAQQRGQTVDEMLRPLKAIANFLKHADRDPTSTSDIDEGHVAVVLQLACHDFGRVTGGMPVEAQVYEAWCTALCVQECFGRSVETTEIDQEDHCAFPWHQDRHYSG